MRLQLEDATVLDPKAFPDSVTSLHDRIEDRDFGLGSRPQAIADPDLQIGVAGIRQFRRRIHRYDNVLLGNLFRFGN